MSKELTKYYCDGICENCEKRKWFERAGFYSCDSEKIKGVTVVSPAPSRWFLDS